MKNYILVLLSVMAIGLLTSGTFGDTKADVVPDTDETVSLLQEKTPVNEESLETLASNATFSSYTYTAPKNTTVKASNNPGYDYQVTAYKATFDAVPLSYTDVYKTNNLIYAHNSSNLFGNLGTHGIGSTISVKENGAITTYLVKDVRIFKKTSATTLELCHNGYNDCTGSHMANIARANLTDIVNGVKYSSNYSVAFMTCTGTSYGNGDASHRLVIYADRI
ncbi:hypothetical protein IJ076_01365 [Candidatus Saccharibacteria bacterium]|nr:hypothetical protein [Candidatus Saccharibacteria bacterium]